jgi:glutathione S-transferase
VWRLTKERYYSVPVVRDGKTVIFEVAPDSQVIAKYVDAKFKLGLFPWEAEGVQSIVWRYIEDEVEGLTFKLNDVYWQEFVPEPEQLRFLRHKERKFGAGCLKRWKLDQKDLLSQLSAKLLPFEEMLFHRKFLLDERPRFIDFDLFGMLGNFLYSGHYRLPAAHDRLRNWHERMTEVQTEVSAREKKLYTGHKRPPA